MVTGKELAEDEGGSMSHNVTHSPQSPLARLGRRVGAFIAECNYAQTRLTSLRNTPGTYVTRGN
jgi:hypothetical protein